MALNLMLKYNNLSTEPKTEEILLSKTGGLEFKEDLINLFEGNAWLEDGEPYILHDPDTSRTDIHRIKYAEWVDPKPPTTFHEHVLSIMNRDTVENTINLARGEAQDYYPEELYPHIFNLGFQEAVQRLIDQDGYEYVFGNEFNLYTLYELVIREIIRDYFRELEIEI